MTVTALACPDPALEPEMRCISLWQPWAHLIVTGHKRIETRSWRAPKDLIGERIGIHAAARRPTAQDLRPLRLAFPNIATRPAAQPVGAQPRMPLAAIVATARLEACLPMVDALGPNWRDHDGEHRLLLNPKTGSIVRTNPRPGGRVPIDVTSEGPYGIFEHGRWAWCLTDVQVLERPVPAKGRQRVWRWRP